MEGVNCLFNVFIKLDEKVVGRFRNSPLKLFESCRPLVDAELAFIRIFNPRYFQRLLVLPGAELPGTGVFCQGDGIDRANQGPFSFFTIQSAQG